MLLGPAACCGPAVGTTNLCHLGSGAGAFNLPLVWRRRPSSTFEHWGRGAAPRPPASSTDATWVELLQRVVAGGLVRAPFDLPLNTGAMALRAGRRRH